MAAFIKSVFEKVRAFVQKTEKKKLFAIAALAFAVLAAGIVGAVLLNRVHYQVLYSGLDASEAGKIKELLDEKGIKSKVEGEGTILVPDDQADELRIELAAEGYPKTGLNYDIFANSSSIGSTDLERRTYLQYQLQENMRATIRRMEKVSDCVVIVNLASDSSFVVSNARTEASVAVLLDLKDGQTLTPEEAKTIGKFVLKCVPDLKPENISVVDSRMNYYDITGEEGGENGSAVSVSQQQMTEQIRQTLTKQVLRVLEPAVGSGNVAVSVNVVLNFDKQKVSRVEFSPPVEGETEGLLRSSQEIYSAVGGAQQAAGGQAGTDTNGSGTPAYVAENPSGEGAETSSTKTYNYELNQIQTEIEKAQGTIEDLSVAVLVNSDIEGISDHAEAIRNLVAKAIGVKPNYVSVEMMPFKGASGIGEAIRQSQQTIQQVSRNNLIKAVVTAVAVLAAVALAGLIYLRIKRPVQAAPERAAAGPGQLAEAAKAEGLPPPSPLEEIDLSELVLKKSSQVEKVEELMERYPETVAQILRAWISEE